MAKFKLKPQTPTEFAHQATLFEWRDKIGRFQYPDTRLMFAIPNYSGKTNYQTHRWYLQQGKAPGVPDICLPVPSPKASGGGHYCGLWIEMKRDARSKPSPVQVEWIGMLRKQGYAVVVCTSASEAIETVVAYLDGFPIGEDNK